MSFWEWVGCSLLGILAIYVVARLVSHAYFKSRDDYERTKNHGTQ